MQNSHASKPPLDAQSLVKLIKQLITEGQYDGVALLFSSATEAKRNVDALRVVATDVLQEVCLKHLNDANYDKNMPLYNCAEELLLLLSTHGPAEDLLLEFLEIVEENKSDNVFTSALKAIQKILLRLLDQRPRAVEWVLNSIQKRITELPLPSYLLEGYDPKQQGLLEQNEEVLRVLMNYITVGLFYDPLRAKLCKRAPENSIFRSTSTDSRNVLCCFLVQLLGRPLALLDLSRGDTKKQTNTYTVQCARNITTAVTECMVDPLYLLSYVEGRVRWKPRLDSAKGVFEMSSHDIFSIEEKLPLVALAIYYYMVLVEGVTRDHVPKVYAPLFIFESGMYLVVELLKQAEPPFHCRGLLLVKELLAMLQTQEIPAVQLELPVHKTFCHELCNIIIYSNQIHLRSEGVKLLRTYILQFDDEGKYVVLQNLLCTIEHNGIVGYLAAVYKDLVSNALYATAGALPSYFSGSKFRDILLENMCCLPKGVETDLIDQSHMIVAALNVIRFIAMKDCDNRTGFWSFTDDIEKQFLAPLRQGLDMSVAHYKNELEYVDKGIDVLDEKHNNLHLLDLQIANESVDENKQKMNLKIDRTEKMELLKQHLCSLDLMRSLLARATECLENCSSAMKSKTNIEK